MKTLLTALLLLALASNAAAFDLGFGFGNGQKKLYGPELMANGSFTTDTAWTKGDGTVTISGGAMNFTGSGAGAFAYQSGLTGVGALYRVTYSITSYTVGSIRVQVGLANGTLRAGVGTYTENIVSTSDNFIRLQTGGATTTLSIDNVSVKRVL